MPHDTPATAGPVTAMTRARPARMRTRIVMLLATLAGGCASPAYYLQSVTGHLRVLAAQQDVVRAVEDARIPPAIRARLADVPALLAFAHGELGLPDNGSYRTYVQLERTHVAWNVFAAPPLSLEPRRWCHPFAGCLAYRGYFSESAALAEAERLRATGDDVYVGGVSAYSTLGWFRDPLVSSMFQGDRLDLAAVLFHELAHQALWFPDDTELNEAFAETVARIGVERLLEREGVDTPAGWRARNLEADRFYALVLEHRRALASLYAAELPPAAKLAGKAARLAQLRQAYRQMQEGHGPGRFAAWLDTDLNNAKLAAVSSYRELVPGLLAVFDASRREPETFYDHLRQLAPCPPAARHQWVRAGGHGQSCPVSRETGWNRQ